MIHATLRGKYSTKGGVGTASFSAQFGGTLADMGQRVLLVDADFQQSLSSLVNTPCGLCTGKTEFTFFDDDSNLPSYLYAPNIRDFLSLSYPQFKLFT